VTKIELYDFYSEKLEITKDSTILEALASSIKKWDSIETALSIIEDLAGSICGLCIVVKGQSKRNVRKVCEDCPIKAEDSYGCPVVYHQTTDAISIARGKAYTMLQLLKTAEKTLHFNARDESDT